MFVHRVPSRRAMALPADGGTRRWNLAPRRSFLGDVQVANPRRADGADGSACSSSNCRTARAGSSSPSGTASAASRCATARRSRCGRSRASRSAAIFPRSPALFGAARRRSASSSTASCWSRLDGALSFDALQARLHPAASRVAQLSAETPAQFIAVRLPRRSAPSSLGRAPLVRAPRRAREAARGGGRAGACSLSPATADRDEARGLARAQRRRARRGRSPSGSTRPIEPGERAMLKVKLRRTADCVVGGFRYDRAGSRSRLAAARALRRRRASSTMSASPRRSPPTSAPPGPRELEALIGRGGVHRQGAGRAEPLVDRAHRRMAAGRARTGRRGALRPGHRRPLPPRHEVAAAAARQGARRNAGWSSSTIR